VERVIGRVSAVRKSTVFFLTLVIALALPGCSGGDAGQEIDIKGKITEVIVGDGGASPVFWSKETPATARTIRVIDPTRFENGE